VHDEPDNELPPHTMELTTLMGWSPTTFDVCHTRPEEPALLHFTSGTTGTPKGAVHVHGAVVAHATGPPTRSTCTRTTSSGAPPIRAG
jgi:acetyl-CoA synthetase